MTLTELGLKEATRTAKPVVNYGGDWFHFDTTQSELIEYRLKNKWYFQYVYPWGEEHYKGIAFSGIFRTISNNYFIYSYFKGKNKKPFGEKEFGNRNEFYYVGKDYKFVKNLFLDFVYTYMPSTPPDARDIKEV